MPNQRIVSGMSAAIGRGAHPWLRGLIGGALHALSLSPGAESVAAGAPVLLQTAALLILLAGLPRQSSPRAAAVHAHARALVGVREERQNGEQRGGR